MIEFDRVSRRFGQQDALRNLNLRIDNGEMALLTGHSGAGKSTLLRLLLLLDVAMNQQSLQMWMHNACLMHLRPQKSG